MDIPPRSAGNRAGDVYGALVQAGDVHGDVHVYAPQVPEAADVALDPPLPGVPVRGREELLGALRGELRAGAPVHVLTGPGGFGKSTAAAALAEHARSLGWTVFWVHSDTLLPGMLEAAVELGGSRAEAEEVARSPRAAARWVWRRLDRADEPWLLVLDGADRPTELDPDHRPGEQRGWVRSSPGGFTLVTSRVDDAALWAPAAVHRLGVLAPGDAAAALADHAGAAIPDDSDADRLPGAEQLAARLGGVPLALSLAGRILATHQLLFPDAEALLTHLGDDAARLDRLAAPLGPEHADSRRTLSGVWELSLRLVGEEQPQAVPLLRLLSLLGPRGRPVPLWRLPLSADSVLTLPGGPVDAAGFARAANALAVHGLLRITSDPDGRGLALHPLIAESARAGISGDGDSEGADLVREAARLLDASGDRDPRFELHARTAVAAQAERFPGLDAEFRVEAGLAEVRSLIQLGRFADADGRARELHALAGETLGPDSGTTLQARHLRIESWLFQERVDEAEHAYRVLLADRLRVLGPEHPRTLDTRHQLAIAAGLRGAWAEARRLHLAIADERLRLQGPHARETLASMDAVGYAALRAGDLNDAYRWLVRVYDARAELLGERDRLTTNSLYKLGVLALRQDRTSLARNAFERVLRNRERMLGSDHPQTLLARDRLNGVPVEPRREHYSGGAVNSG